MNRPALWDRKPIFLSFEKGLSKYATANLEIASIIWGCVSIVQYARTHLRKI